MEMNFCRRCGSILRSARADSFICEQGHAIYRNPLPTVAVFFIDSDENVILGVRGAEPNKGTLDSFGGFVDGSESVEEALEREIKEETGLTPDDYSKPIYVVSKSATYEFKGEALQVVDSVFYALLNDGASPSAGDDVADIKRVPMKDVVASEIGNEDVRAAFEILRDMLTNQRAH